MKKYIYQYIIVLIACFLPGIASAQEITIKGVVTDEISEEGVPGATVVVKGTTKGTVTDFDGNYSIEVEEDAILSVSFIGYLSQDINVAGRSVIDIVLEEDTKQLDEVVVIGYGTQKKKVVTGAIESLSSKDISLTPIVSADQALQGRAAGVQVVNQSGQPGEKASIKIRGIGTDYNSEPLYLVDGIAVSGIDNVNPGDIKSIEVLKDAASAAIYGARAANGVVLITTKTGGSDGYSVTYSGYYGVQNVARTVDLLNARQYVALMSDAGASNLYGEAFDPNEVPKNDTNWQNELFTENAPIQNHEISVNGGNEKSSISSSFSYFKQNGIIGGEKSAFERYTARLNSRTKINEVFTWGNTLSYARIETRGVTSNGSFNGEYSSALNIDPLTAVYENDQDALNDVPYSNEPYIISGSGQPYAISRNVGGEIVNPLARLENQNQIVNKDQVLGSVYAEIKPIEGLTLKSTVGLDLAYLRLGSYTDLYYLSSTTNNTILTGVSEENQRIEVFQSEHTANYTKRIGRHNFNFLAGLSTNVTNWEVLAAGGQGVDTSNPDLIYLDLSIDSTQTAGGVASEVKRASIFSRILYDYNDRVSLSATYRRDGSSNFGSNNRFGDFWSFGASWVINEEPFFPQVDFLSFLKLRASWGQNGNDNIRPFAFASVVDFKSVYNLSNGAQNGAIPEFVENQDVKWENSEQLNVGLETGFFENRLTANFDYYKKVTKDLLQKQIGLASIGVPLSWANIGTMENEGVEISLDYRGAVGEFKFGIGVNGAYNKNTMVEVANEAGFINGANWALAGEVSRTIEGQPVTSFYGFRTDGIFQSDAEVFAHISSEGFPIQPDAEAGDIRFVDVDGDGEITDEDRTVIGSPIPNWTMGSTINLSYKNFSVSALITGQFGNEIFNGINRPDITTSNRQTWILDRWTETNPSNTVPRFTVADQNQNYKRATDMINIENGSYVRLKNVQIGYNLPTRALDKFNCTAWRFYISGENLVTITDYSGPDPEVGSPIDFGGSGVSSVRDMGIDRGIYPQARTFRIGTTITF